MLERLLKERPRLIWAFQNQKSPLKSIIASRLPKSVILSAIHSISSAMGGNRKLMKLYADELRAGMVKPIKAYDWKPIFRGSYVSPKELQEILRTRRPLHRWLGRAQSFSVYDDVAITFARRSEGLGIPVVIQTVARPRKYIPAELLYEHYLEKTTEPSIQQILKNAMLRSRPEREVIATMSRRSRLLDVKLISLDPYGGIKEFTGEIPPGYGVLLKFSREK